MHFLRRTLGGVEPEMVGEVLTVIRDLVNQEGLTTVISTQETGFAREVADRVAVFSGGEIIEAGTPEKIFTDPESERTKLFLSRILKRRMGP